jgi:two-component system nitrate/nitrite response regulator NarL
MTMSASVTPPVPPTEAAAPGGQRVRVLVADGNGLARRMMSDTLRQADRLLVVGTARDKRETIELACHYRPDVLVMDISLAPNASVELIARVLERTPETRILVVSDDDDDVLAALRAGAVGHASKDLEPDDLVDLVLRSAAGEAIVGRRLVMPLLKLVQATPDAGWRPLRSRLTTREWEVVELLASGASTQCIADKLVLSATTVYSHIKSLLRKLGVHSRDEAVKAAQRLRDEEIADQTTAPPFA